MSQEDRLAELDDAAWNDAVDLAAGLAEHAPGPLGGDELLERILAAVHRAGDAVLSDIDPTDLTALIPEVRRGRGRPRPGDVIAIPAGDDRYIRVVLVANNPFGTAFGVFVDLGEPRLPANAVEAPVLRYPIYSDDEQVRLGRWCVVGHVRALLDRFPRVPELMQLPSPDGPGDRGAHGQARSPEGPVRRLSSDEARDAGMRVEGYRESFMSEELEAWLPTLLGQLSR